MDNDTDLAGLDDPTFLTERRRVREELERRPGASAELSAWSQRLDAEFLRRAQLSWTGGW